MHNLLLALHVFAAVIWVGGMFFAHLSLRPAALELEMIPRIELWHRVLKRFFFWVWVSVILLPVSGYGFAYSFFGGVSEAGRHVLIMQILGWSMIFIFIGMYFRYFKRMQKMIKERLMPEAGLYLNRIRVVVLVNLILGVVTILVASAGRSW